jgi:hypothetical protein
MNWLANTYTVPTTFTSYTTTTNPVQYSSNPVVLSGISGVSSNNPDSTVSGNYTTAFSGISVPGLSNATYSTSATLLRMDPSPGVTWLGSSTGGVVQTWQITSQGSISGLRTATVQVVATYERTGTPVFNYAIAATGTGCDAIDFGGSDGTDSYNSNNGAYNSSTNHSTTGGNIAANGNITLASSSVVVDGTISGVNTTVTTSNCSAGLPGVTNDTGKAITSTPITKMTPAAPWNCGATTPCYPAGYPSPTRSTTTQDVSTSCSTIPGCTKSASSVTLYDGGKSTTAAVYTLTPGTYDNLEIDNADVVHVTAGTYTVNSLDFAQDGQLVVDSGPVTFNLAGQGCTSTCGKNPSDTVVNSGGLSGWNLCAPIMVSGVSTGVTGNPGVYPSGTSQDASCGSTKAAISGIPANFQMIYAGAAEIQTTGAPMVGVIYAPNAALLETGGAVGYYGSVVTGTFSEQSKAPFHYDSSLQSSAVQVGPFKPVGGFSWSKF